MTLDLNQLAVESFSTSVDGDPSQWLIGPPPTEGCDTNLAAPPAETHERICTTV